MTMVPAGNSIFTGTAFTTTVCCLVVPLASLTVMTAARRFRGQRVFLLFDLGCRKLAAGHRHREGPAPPTSVSVPVEPTVSVEGAASVSVGRLRTISDSSRVAPVLSWPRCRPQPPGGR